MREDMPNIDYYNKDMQLLDYMRCVSILLEEDEEEVLPYAEDLKITWLEKGINLLLKFKPIDSYKKPGIFVTVESLGTHTMRKTFGYWFYKQTKDIACLCYKKY